MKTTFRSILKYAVALILLLCIAALVDRFAPKTESVPAETVSAPVNEAQETGATVITLTGETANVSGLGAVANGAEVTVVYPGTYRISGSLTGQLIVDCGDFDGGVYILLEGADIENPAGPALLVNQCDLVTVTLGEGTENSLRDGESYTVRKAGEEQDGACLLSDDDLVINGDGALTVYGCAADGIRSRDGLTVESGKITVYAAKHGMQGSDFVELAAADITVGAYGDGIRVTKDNLRIDGTNLAVNAGGDGLAAATELTVVSGNVTVTTCGGAENYAYSAQNLVSAKGLKAQDIEILDGTVTLDTAEDGIHGDGSVTLYGGAVTISSGDDAISSDGAVELKGGDMTVKTAYEGIEGLSVAIEGGSISLLAEKNAVQTGTEGFFMNGGTLYASAPRCIGSDGRLKASGGELYLVGTDPEESSLSFGEGSVTGATLVVLGNGLPADMLYEGAMPRSFAFSLKTAAAAGTQATVTDASGRTLYTLPLWQDASFIQIAGGAFGVGQTYTLTVGDAVLTGTLTEDCTVVS